MGYEKNQTPEESITSLAGAAKKHQRDKGTGIFLIPAPQKGILEYDTVLVEDLTYDECVKRGENCVAFKWIHEGLATAHQLKTKKADCGVEFCGKTFRCKNPHCICPPNYLCKPV